MSIQLEKWAGYFGNDYTRRSLLSYETLVKRSMSFGTIFELLRAEPTVKYDPASVLEVGCNIGINLLALKPHIFSPGVIVGVEPNEIARRIAILNGVTVFPDCGQELSFLDGFFDLVFSCGMLIHCELEDAEKIVSEMKRVSSRLLMFLEYFATEDEEIPYRGETNLCWRRPWPTHFEKWGLGVPSFSGVLPIECGFDNVHWWIYKK
jgi:SAM-dependent methyltransferase